MLRLCKADVGIYSVALPRCVTYPASTGVLFSVSSFTRHQHYLHYLFKFVNSVGSQQVHATLVSFVCVIAL